MKVKNLTIKDRITELREEKNISQLDLANSIGCGKTIVYYWETGQREPNSQMIVALAKFFNVSTDYILGLEDEIGAKTEKVVKKFSYEDFTPEEIEMIKGIRELNFTDQNALKVVLNSFLSKNSTTKEKVKK